MTLDEADAHIDRMLADDGTGWNLNEEDKKALSLLRAHLIAYRIAALISQEDEKPM